MTAQLSREQLLADIAHAEEKAATLCGACAEDHARLAGYMRMLLAGMDSEPVAWWTGPEPTPTGEIESIHDHETGSHSIPLVAGYTAQPPAPVADEWRSALQEMVNAMIAYEMTVDEPAPYKHRKMMMRAGHLLESHRAAMLKAGPVMGWIKCSERLPPEGHESDGSAICYLVWHKHKVDCGPQYGISNVVFLRKHWEKWYTHWMPLPSAPEQEV